MRAFAALLTAPPAGAAVPLESAAHASALAMHYASVAVPFDASTLVPLWTGCIPPPGSEACALGLEQIREMTR